MTPQFPPFRSPTHHQFLSRFIVLGLDLVGLTSITLTRPAAQAKPSPSGWLMVQRLKGDVTYRRRSIRVARLGDRLDQVGAGLATNERSAATLKLDSNMPISVSREGQVETLLTQGDNNFVEVVVSNPLGESRTEKLWLYRGK